MNICNVILLNSLLFLKQTIKENQVNGKDPVERVRH